MPSAQMVNLILSVSLTDLGKALFNFMANVWKKEMHRNLVARTGPSGTLVEHYIHSKI